MMRPRQHLARRAIDQIVFGLPPETTPEDRIVALCREVSLFVDRFQFANAGEHLSRSRMNTTFRLSRTPFLTLHFDDVRPEEFTPSYAGNASRVDFYLPRERIIVEAKMTRNNLGQKEVANELGLELINFSFEQYDIDLYCGELMSRNLFWLSDEQWVIEPHLPKDVRMSSAPMTDA
jgi:hypothetical protein